MRINRKQVEGWHERARERERECADSADGGLIMYVGWNDTELPKKSRRADS